MKAAAPIHLAMKIEHVRAPAAGSGTCRATGPITKLFRDRTGRLKLGQRITVSLDCLSRDARPRPGGVIWMSADRLKPGRTLKTFLNERLGVAAQGSGTTVTGD